MTEPTNAIGGETNGTSDVIALLRTYATAEQSHEDPAHVILERGVFGRLADMVERDYVKREYHANTVINDARQLKEVLEGRDEMESALKAATEAADIERGLRKEAEAERDKLSNMLNMENIAYYKTKYAMHITTGSLNDLIADRYELQAERDEWKAKYLGAVNKSAKRAAAVERLKSCRYVGEGDLMRAMLGWGHEPHTDFDLRFALISLLEDDGVERSNDGATNLEWLFEHDREKLIAMASESCGCDTCVYGWHLQESWQCADERWAVHCTEGNREWLMAPHEDGNGTRPDGNGTCPNDDYPPENDVSATDADANAANANLGSEPNTSEVFDGKGSEVDSRKKLEEIAWEYDVSYAEPFEHGAIAEAIISLLDRQEAITRAELQSEIDKRDRGIARLKRQRDEARAELGEIKGVSGRLEAALDAVEGCDERCMGLERERDMWRMRCGELLDAAHGLQGIADGWEE